MCVFSLIFVLVVYLLISISGGVDVKERFLDQKELYVTGCISDKVLKNDSYCFYLEKCYAEPVTNTSGIEDFLSKNEENRKKIGIKNYQKLLVYFDDINPEDYKIGQKILVKGEYRNFPLAENDGQFNSRQYYRIRGYEATIRKAKLLSQGQKYNWYKNLLYNYKIRTEKIYGKYMSEREASTLSAMTLGDKTGLDEEVKNLYQTAGIAHVLSLSGLHIATVGLCVYSLLYKIGLGVIPASSLSSLMMISYGFLTGMSTSTKRALIMFLIAIIGKLIGRTYDLLSAASLSSILILFENPYFVYDSGFLLSFLSVVGIGLLYPVLNDVFEEYHKLVSRIMLSKAIKTAYNSDHFTKIRQSICISFSATLSTLPVIMTSFYRTSRYSVFVNLIVVPLMSLILFLGILSGIIGNAFLHIPIFEGIVKITLFITEKILLFYIFLSERISSVRGNTWVVGEGEKINKVVYITVMLILCLFYQTSARKKMINSLHNITKNGKEKNKRIIAVPLIIIFSLLVLLYKKPPEFSINSLSVGQGLCTVVYGSKVPTIIIDGGSSDVKKVGKYRIVPFLLSKGIDSIDYVFISHPDEDHINGILELLSDEYKYIRIRHVFMSVEDERIIELAKKRQIETHIIGSGDFINNDRLNISCCSPVKGTEIDLSNLNDASLVLKISYLDFDALFPGDISSEVEGKLLVDNTIKQELKNVEFLCIPHHGSKYSSSEEFIENLKPLISTISCGKNNRYGHPHGETLYRLKHSNTSIFRTDEKGQISILYEGGRVGVRCFIN